MDIIEQVVSELQDGAVSSVIRPAARLDEQACRAILVELALLDVRNGGTWLTTPTRWELFDGPWTEPDGAGLAQLLGTIHIVFGSPTAYEITIYRATVTSISAAAGWTVEMLCDAALSLVGLTLAGCPRVELADPPPVFRFGR
jgi:hypothetical protein